MEIDNFSRNELHNKRLLIKKNNRHPTIKINMAR